MRLSHTVAAVSASFDDDGLVSCAGLVPLVALAEAAGLRRLSAAGLSVPTDKGANPGGKVMTLVAGMAAGADSIEDMDLLRHGGMSRLFGGVYAPSTLGSFLRSFTFGHVRQLDGVASRFLLGLADRAPLLPGLDSGAMVCVDLDDTIIEVHGHAKQGAAFGYSRVRGLNALLATASTSGGAPIVLAQRLRKGNTGSPKGAERIVRDTLAALRRLREQAGSTTDPAVVGMVLLRADSAFYGRPTIAAAIKAGAAVSVTARMDPQVKAAISKIAEDAWTPIEYTDAILDEESGPWISRAEVAEIPFTAFTSARKADHIEGRLVVRRIPDFNAPKNKAQASLFEVWRFHAFFTTSSPETLDTVDADKTHRAHAIIENVHADLKASALAHLPSGKFTANSAWLVCAVMAFNLTRAAGTLAGGSNTRATTSTLRKRLVNIPARLASSARRITLHLPAGWRWKSAWHELFANTCGPPQPVTT